ncbi:MAG TPA: threonine synthase [Firmicutes bacterium]|nr:threonine synthase [Bacillota bacterium]
MGSGVLRRYRQFLPVTDRTPLITLGEGDTPLLECRALPRIAGAPVRLLVKFEGMNPTGSFKDRGMVVAVAKALERGTRAVVCASTGNTSASAAAYAASTGLRCYVIVPEGNIALGKLAQALIYGARVIAVQGSFDDALSLVRRIAADYAVTLVNSINPDRIEGQKTAAFEICDVLGDAPDYLVLPVGNAGNITAYWKGFCEYHAAGKTSHRPRMVGFQAEGAAPIVKGHPVEKPETIATAIRIGNPASWGKAVAARDESGGLIDTVTDAEILQAMKVLASSEGIFAEPASCASIAGFLKMAAKGYFREGSVVVCVLTGHGLKDPNTAISICEKPQAVKPVLEDVLAIMGLKEG